MEVNALPFRAYVKIWNEFFRDQNVGNPATLITSDENVIYSDQNNENDTETILKEAYRGGRCLPVSRFHDYFSSCLPYPQRGPEVTIALTGNAPVYVGTPGNGLSGNDKKNLSIYNAIEPNGADGKTWKNLNNGVRLTADGENPITDDDANIRNNIS